MTRQERKRFFERLVALRDAYRAERHAATKLTIDAAMTLAERRLAELAATDVEAGTPAKGPRRSTQA